jgi:hypothetical protein
MGTGQRMEKKTRKGKRKKKREGKRRKRIFSGVQWRLRLITVDAALSNYFFQP